MNPTQDTQEKSTVSIENVLTNLKILASVKPDEKLTKSEEDILIVDPPAYTQGAFRWWNSNSRTESMNDIEKLIESTFSIIDDIYSSELEETTGSTTDNNYYAKRVIPQTYFKTENASQLQTFSTELTNSIKGLQNLKLTYQKDISICSRIDVIIEKINIRINKINKLLTIKPNACQNIIKK